MQEWANRRVYIVGGSQGIGLAVAQRCASLGAHLTVFARRKQPLEDAATAIRAGARSAAQHIGWRQMDAGDAVQVAAELHAAMADTGVPDVLLNCAGGAQPNYFEQISVEQLTETLRINVHACWNPISVLVPHMKARGGYIVNTSSLAGLIGVFGYTDYCAAKFAVVGFSEALRSELKPYGIAVSVLCPPDTDTPGFAAENLNKPAETRAVSSAARVLSADAVATALLRGMARQSFLIIPGREGRLAAMAKRLLPGVVARVMDLQVQRARRSGA